MLHGEISSRVMSPKRPPGAALLAMEEEIIMATQHRTDVRPHDLVLDVGVKN